MRTAPLCSVFFAVLVWVVLTALPASAIKPVGQYHQEAMLQMRDGQWAEAHKTLVEVTTNLDRQAPTIIGPRFGWFWYHRGFAAMRLRAYEDAALSFKTCYERYPNRPSDLEKSENVYWVRSLLKWGDALKATEQWEQALEKYRKFLTDRDPTRDKFEPGPFYINIAICSFKMGQIGEGIKHLETAIVNKATFPTPDRGIISAFQALVEAVITAKNEQALIDFIGKNRGVIKLDPYEAYDFARLFMKLAQDAKSAEMYRATFELYSLVPSTQAVIDDVNAVLKTIAGQRRPLFDNGNAIAEKDLKTILAAAKEQVEAGNTNEVYALLNTAVLHESVGNPRGAFTCYLNLELYYPNAHIIKDNKLAPMREHNLYNLVRTSSVIGEVLLTEKYGSRFLKLFPGSEYEPDVQRMMLTSLFWNGEYVTAIEVANEVLKKMAPNEVSEQNDIALFVRGGSYYYTGKYDEAQEELDAYLKKYPEDRTEAHRHQAALYFQASNLTRLQEWSKAGALLDLFLKKYPEASANPYLAYALYDRANSHFALDEFEEALVILNRVEDEFPSSPLEEIVFNLKGNVLQALNRPEEAEDYYKRALATAETRKNRFVVGETLFYLVALIGEQKKGAEPNPRFPEAAEFYDKFWNEYKDESPYKAQVAVAGMPSLQAADRDEEALERLQIVITEISKVPGTPGLEEAINSYTEAYLKDHSVVELKDHYYDFPGIDATDSATRALLRIAIIGVVEDERTKALAENKTDEVAINDALIRVLFNDLKSEFDPKILTNFVLVRIGDFLREKTSEPMQAKPYYEEVLGRTDVAYRFPALFGLADVLGQGDSSAKKEAIGYLERVYADGEDKVQREKALFRIITIQAENENHTEVIKRAKDYLSPEAAFRTNSTMVQLALGRSYERSGQAGEAMAVYAQIWAGPSMSFVQASAPAIMSWGELVWSRNGTDAKTGKKDRQYAYDSLANYVKLMGRNYERMTDEDQERFKQVEAMLTRFGASSDVTKPTDK